MRPPNVRTASRLERCDSSSTRAVAHVLKPSSIHPFSNSLDATTAYHHWCPVSCVIVESGVATCAGDSQLARPVKIIGYSRPSLLLSYAGSTIVRLPYG